jgi:hypothetical protein
LLNRRRLALTLLPSSLSAGKPLLVLLPLPLRGASARQGALQGRRGKGEGAARARPLVLAPLPLLPPALRAGARCMAASRNV